MSSGWRAEVYKNGIRKSKILRTKAEAKDWSARTLYLIENQEEEDNKTLFVDVLDRYAREVSPKKKGARWEVIRLEKLKKYPIARIQIGKLQPKDFAEWRDARLKDVAPASVIREMNLLSAVLTRSIREWGLINKNPISSVSKPSKPKPRQRIPTQDELEALAKAVSDDLYINTNRAHHAWLFALETAMRAGEITGLTWDKVNLEDRYIHLSDTKNNHSRDVPLSKEAVRLLEMLPKMEPVFGLSSQQLDALWRKLKKKANVEGLTFHDSRAAAITRLARKLDPLDLARMSGHKDLKMLISVYYREDAASIAKRLD